MADIRAQIERRNQATSDPQTMLQRQAEETERQHLLQNPDQEASYAEPDHANAHILQVDEEVKVPEEQQLPMFDEDLIANIPTPTDQEVEDCLLGVHYQEAQEALENCAE